MSSSSINIVSSRIIASNGLINTGLNNNTIALGGTLSGNTVVDQSGFFKKGEEHLFYPFFSLKFAFNDLKFEFSKSTL